MLIGLTGPSCAGKNYIAKLLEARGIACLDVDALGHQASEENAEKIISLFGPEICGPNGKIDRRLLAKAAFTSPSGIKDLEAIIHPAVHRLVREWVESEKKENKLINAALLHRTEYFNSFDFIILVKAATIVRLWRAKKRDRLPISQILKRFYLQRNFFTQYSSKKTDTYSVYNRAFFPLFRGLWNKAVQRRLDKILEREGLEVEIWNRKKLSG